MPLAGHLLGPVHALRHLRVRRLGDVRELAVRRRSAPGPGSAGTLRLQRLAGARSRRRRAAACTRPGTRRTSAAGSGSACGTGRCTPGAGRRRGSGPCRPAPRPAQASVPDGRHPIHELAHELVFGRHRLAPALVVELAAVVVRRVVAGGHVQPAVGLQVADGERQLRRGDVPLAVGREDVASGCRWPRTRRRRTGRTPGWTGAAPGSAGRGRRRPACPRTAARRRPAPPAAGRRRGTAACRYSQCPWTLAPTVQRFMRFGPMPTAPRRPPVPNGITW